MLIKTNHIIEGYLGLHHQRQNITIMIEKRSFRKRERENRSEEEKKREKLAVL